MERDLAKFRGVMDVPLGLSGVAVVRLDGGVPLGVA